MILADMAHPDANRDVDSSGFVELIETMTDFPKPLIAAVNGVCVGFGITVRGFADLVFLSSEARLKCPFTALAAPPEAASTYLLPLLLGRQNAAWTLLSSGWISATEARDIGLVLKICSPDELLTVAQHTRNCSPINPRRGWPPSSDCSTPRTASTSSRPAHERTGRWANLSAPAPTQKHWHHSCTAEPRVSGVRC
ncbi:enoyl-CoA hydratase/isomerase family protein [Mycolicibacterium sp. 050232]|uniref:enoyl-CoA hydratase/isomerase family protein n=1 Tax=Mycolicibacterium sp. 050232 TaxID=3113982 RepID=UPI003FA57120